MPSSWNNLLFLLSLAFSLFLNSRDDDVGLGFSVFGLIGCSHSLPALRC